MAGGVVLKLLSITSPKNTVLLVLTCLLQAAVLVLPIPFMGVAPVAFLVLIIISAFVVVSSVSNAILFLIFASTVIPGYVSQEYLILPIDFKFAEGLFLAVMFLALLTALKDRVGLPATQLDRPVTVFLFLVVASCVIGVYLGHSISQLLRDVRYPFYYALFFVVTAFFPRGRHKTLIYVILAISAVVAIEYLAEFLSAINLSISGTFERVARIEGLLLPIGALVIGAAWLYAPGRHVRLVSGLALIPIGLSFVLTVGRGMWISAVAGFGALGLLYLFDRQRVDFRNVLMTVSVPVLIVVMGLAFQAATKTGVVAVAARRLARIQTFEEDHSISGRLVSYQNALTKIARRPIVGGGHGETVSFPVVKTAVPHVAVLGAVDNVYLTILLRMGGLGLAAFLWIYFRGLRLAYNLFQHSQEQSERFFAAAFVAVYSAMLVYGLADSTLMTTRLIFIHAVLLGVLARLTADREDAWSIT